MPEQGIERPAPGAPPSAFRIWTIGKISSSKGEFLFTEESARLVLEAQDRQGSVEFPFDFDHRMLDADASPEARAAAGFHRLEMRGPELWAVACRWTERAAKLITSGEYRYHSPTFTASTGGEITGYLGCALTNTPATRDCLPVAASRHATLGFTSRPGAARTAHSVASVVHVIGSPTPRALSSDPTENTEDRKRQRQSIAEQSGLVGDIQGWRR